MAGFVIPTVEEVISTSRDNVQYSELRFPDDLGPHSIIFNFSDYSFDRNAKKISSVTTASICLPIPSSLRDSFAIKLQSTELGAVGDLTRSLAGRVAANGGDVQGALQSAVDSGDLSTVAATRVIKAVLASADNAFVKGAEAGLGLVVNPHVALTFEGMDLKTHNFDWMFAPSSPSESVRLQKIIKTFKKSILPKYQKDTARTFLQYPKVVDIFFMGTETGYLYFFKRCMVSDFDVDYAPQSIPAFLPGGRPAFVQIKMSLREMEIHTADDYED